MTRPRVFVDTWAWLAWSSEKDPAHRAATQKRADLLWAGVLLVTQDLVLAEALTRLRYDVGLPTALTLVLRVEALLGEAALEFIFVDPAIWSDALTWFRRFHDQRFSFVDCTSFAIMHARGIDDALTADRHFATAGFTPLGV